MIHWILLTTDLFLLVQLDEGDCMQFLNKQMKLNPEDEWEVVEMRSLQGRSEATEPIISIRKDVVRFNSYLVRSAPSLFLKNKFAQLALNKKRRIISCRLFQSKEENTRTLHLTRNSRSEPTSASVMSKHLVEMLKSLEIQAGGAYGAEFRELETMKTGNPTFWVYLDQPK